MSDTTTRSDRLDYKTVRIGTKKIIIPTDWNTHDLCEIAREGNKTFTDGDWVESSDMTQNGDYQLIQLGNIGIGHFRGQCDKFVSRNFVEEKNCTILEPGDLLISRLAEPVLRTIIMPEFDRESITSVDVVIAKIDEKNWSKKYVCHLLNSKILADVGSSLATGSTRQRISRSNMAKITIPRPPLPEQRRIAEILSTVDELIHQTDAVIEETKRLKRGLMQDLLTKGIGHESFKKVSFGPVELEIPGDWKITQINELADVQYGKSLPDSSGQIPAVGSSGIYSSVGEYLVTQNTIVVGRKGSAGEAYMLQGKSWPSDTTFYLDSFNEQKHDINYLYYFMKYDSLADRIEQTTIPSLDRNLLETYQVLTPPLPEQRSIAEILSTVDDTIQEEQQTKMKLESLKRGLMQDLLTGKVRVPIET